MSAAFSEERRSINGDYVPREENLSRLMTLPANNYKENAKLAVVLSFYERETIYCEMMSQDLRALHQRGVDVLPTIFFDIGSVNKISTANIHMLLNLPKGRLEQINTLCVLFQEKGSKESSIIVKKSIFLAIEQLYFSLKNVKYLYMSLHPEKDIVGQSPMDISTMKFLFDLTHARDRQSRIKYLLNEFPIYTNNASVKIFLDILKQRPSVYVITTALVLIDEKSRAFLKEYKSLSKLRWILNFNGKYLTEEDLVNVAGVRLWKNTALFDSYYKPELCTYLYCAINSHCSPGDFFARKYPNLLYLALEDSSSLCKGCQPIYNFPKLVGLALHFFPGDAVIDLGDVAYHFLQLRLRGFEGKFQKADNIIIDDLYLDSTISEPALALLCQRSSKLQMLVASESPEASFTSLVFFSEHLTNLSFHFIRQSKCCIDICKVNVPSYLQTMEILHSTITISPRIFPRLRTLILIECNIQFYDNGDTEESHWDFTELRSLALESATILKPPASVEKDFKIEDGTLAKCFYIHASNLATLSLGMTSNRARLLFSSLYCPMLEMINWRCEWDFFRHHCVFDMDDPQSLHFKRLKTFVMDREMRWNDPKIEYPLNISIDSVNILYLLSDIVVPNFQRMRLACQYASFSVNFLKCNLPELSQLSASKLEQSTLEKIREVLLPILPKVKLLIVEGNLLISSEGRPNLVDEKNDNEEREKFNAIHSTVSSQRKNKRLVDVKNSLDSFSDSFPSDIVVETPLQNDREGGRYSNMIVSPVRPQFQRNLFYDCCCYDDEDW